jgi:ketosteroid isomerase-like protein
MRTDSGVGRSQSPEQSTPFQSLMRFYEAEGRYSATGDAADRRELLATLHPDIVLYQPESLPYGGEWRGREAFGKWLDAFVQTWTDITPTELAFYTCGDDTLIAVYGLLPKLNVEARAIARSSHITYLRMARGVIVATAQVAASLEDIVETLRTSLSMDLEVFVSLTDGQSDVVSTMNAIWYVKRAKSNVSRMTS